MQHWKPKLVWPTKKSWWILLTLFIWILMSLSTHCIGCVVLWSQETSTYRWSRFCTVNCKLRNYQLSHIGSGVWTTDLRGGRRVLPLQAHDHTFNIRVFLCVNCIIYLYSLQYLLVLQDPKGHLAHPAVHKYSPNSPVTDIFHSLTDRQRLRGDHLSQRPRGSLECHLGKDPHDSLRAAILNGHLTILQGLQGFYWPS